MNREQKAAAIEEVATQIQESEAVLAVDYRGISVPQAAELRTRLTEAGARFRVVKNTLTERAADQAGAEGLKEFLEGPTAFTFVVAEGGDVALAAKALATFRRETELLGFKGGIMNGDPLTADQLEALSRLPARDVLHSQLVGMIASPITGLVRGLNALISGLAIQLGQIRDQGLVGGDAPAEEAAAPADETPAQEAAALADETPAEEAAAPAGETPAEEAAAPPGETPGGDEAGDSDDDTSDDTSSDDTSSDDAPAEEAAADETAPAAEEAPDEAAAEGDGTETDETDAPSEGDKTE